MEHLVSRSVMVIGDSQQKELGEADKERPIHHNHVGQN